MDRFAYRHGTLCADDVPLTVIAKAVGTPCYIYAQNGIADAFGAFQQALVGVNSLICYAVKANGTLAILATLAGLGAGFDIVSGGELERVLAAGGDPARVVFSGVGKTESEMRYALTLGIRCFNVESQPELERLEAIAAACGRSAPVSLRVNPDVDARTHPYIATGLRDNKFGLPLAVAAEIYRHRHRYPHCTFVGIDCHIGSQLTTLQPFVDALDRVLPLVSALATEGLPLAHIDVGGGLGIRYQHERPPPVSRYVAMVCDRLMAHGLTGLELLFEPGRALVAASGVLMARVQYLKVTDSKRFAIIDAGMNDLIRPALYGAWQDIQEVCARPGAALAYDVVGPVCESADVLGRDRQLAMAAGDLLVVRDAGAYGFAMSSQYNARPRPAEVLVDGDRFAIVRERETITDLMRGEHWPPPWVQGHD
ncbi:MAG: diaminopimelate decarboxylase [Acidiferrobacter sp.]